MGAAIQIDPRWFPADDVPVKMRLKMSATERRVLVHPEQIRVSAWAEQHRELPATAAIPGRWHNRNAPYLAGVMDAINYPSVKEAVLVFPPQFGKTEGVYNYIGYTADRRPGDWLIIFPGEKEVKENAAKRLQPMFLDSPRLRTYLTGKADDMAATAITLKHMTLYMAWPTPSRLASKPLPYVYGDEVDKYVELASKKETSPLNLARMRTRTYRHMRKVIISSTPTVPGGPIWVAWEEECHLRFVYLVRCPVCGLYQLMVFDREHYRWDEDVHTAKELGIRQKAWYVCDGCAMEWMDAERDEAVRLGEWREKDSGMALERALEVHKPHTIGFNAPSWISPFVSLWEPAVDFLKGQASLTDLKHFKNAHETVPWVVKKQVRKVDRILKLKDERPRGCVPGGGVVAALTGYADTQDDGFWFQVMAWGYGDSGPGWVVRQGFVLDLEALVRVFWGDEYKDTAGNVYPIQLAGIDSGGHRTAEVYDFCRTKRGLIYPTKGASARMPGATKWSTIEYYPGTGKQKAIPGGIKLLMINTQYFKDHLSTQLGVAPEDPGAIRFDSEMDSSEAAHFISEYVDEKGVWACKSGDPNHLWDCLVGNKAVREVLGVRYWKQPEELPAPAVISEHQPETMTKRSGYQRPGWMS